MLLDEMHDNDHHMMDWMSGGELNWVLILIGWIIFLLFVCILLYLLFRGKNPQRKDIELHNQSIQEVSSINKTDNIRYEGSYFCPNCGEKLENRALRYCPKCGCEL